MNYFTALLLATRVYPWQCFAQAIKYSTGMNCCPHLSPVMALAGQPEIIDSGFNAPKWI